MDKLKNLAKKTSEILIENNQTISVAESSSGGLISSALLALPGASKYYLGGQVIYTAASIRVLSGMSIRDLKEKKIRSSSEAFALLMAEKVCQIYGSNWGIGETGAAGPTGNGYGDPPGYSCLAVCGEREISTHVLTNSDNRRENMEAFALAALDLFIKNF